MNFILILDFLYQNFISNPLRCECMNKHTIPLKELPVVARPREKMLRYGAAKLTTKELLALLIRSGRKGSNVLQVADEVLAYFGESQLFDATVEELSAHKGIGPAKAVEMIASFELAKRFYRHEKVPKCTNPQYIWQRTKTIHQKKQEHIIVFALNGAGEEINHQTIFVGSLTNSLIHPREVYEYAVTQNAAAIVIVHNHPSGNCEPSDEDVIMTHRIQKSGTIMGIPLLDHVVVTKEGYYSFFEEGRLKV